MVAVVILAVIAIVLIRSLMSVVARDEAVALPPWSPDYTSVTDPTVELRATTNDDVRGFLLPAATDPAEIAETEPAGVNEQTQSQR
jgi:hypothetical protein